MRHGITFGGTKTNLIGNLLALGRIDEAAVAEHRRVVARYELSAQLPDGSDTDELVRLFARDKKATRGVTFVLDGDKGVEQVTGVAPDVLLDALEAIR